VPPSPDPEFLSTILSLSIPKLITYESSSGFLVSLKMVRAAFLNSLSSFADSDNLHYINSKYAPAFIVPVVMARVDMKSLMASSSYMCVKEPEESHRATR
jgi:hypothetical protein